MLLKYLLHVPVINGYLFPLERRHFINALVGLGGKLGERIFTSAEESEGNLSYLHYHCRHCRPACVYATESLCSGGFLGSAKLRKYCRNLLNICHTAKRWFGDRGWRSGGSLSWQWKYQTYVTHSKLNITLHKDSGLWWNRTTLPHTLTPCWGKCWVFFFSFFFFFRVMNAPTKCIYASLVPHWRRWCHLSARLVTSQGVYCHPKVSYLKCHSQQDKWQDAALCTCSGQRKLSGPKHISSTDPERQIHSVQRKVSVIVY